MAGKTAKAPAKKKAAAKKVAAKKVAAKKPAAAPQAVTTAAADTPSTFAQLEQVKKDLEAISEKLNGIDPDSLDAAKRKDWTHEMQRVDLAIIRARSALQRNLLDAFAGEIGAIGQATDQLASSLASLNKAAQVIDAVAGVLGVLEKVITLGR